MAKKKDPRLARAGVSGYNKPKRTPSHPTKSHIVLPKKVIRLKLFVLVNKVRRLQVNLKLENLVELK